MLPSVHGPSVHVDAFYLTSHAIDVGVYVACACVNDLLTCKDILYVNLVESLTHFMLVV